MAPVLFLFLVSAFAETFELHGEEQALKSALCDQLLVQD